MGIACPRCGTETTDPVTHGFAYNLCRKFGYHLRRCANCHRRRLLKHRTNHHHSNEPEMEELSQDYSRQLERASPRPLATNEISDGNPASDMNNKSGLPSAVPSLPPEGNVESPKRVGNYYMCPTCGSTDCHRSRRRWWERLIKRPPMARCHRCNHRFPYVAV